MAAPAVVLLAACSAQPTAPAPVLPAATSVTPSPAAARANDPRYAEFVKSARAQGYRPVTTSGKQLWCREESALDSRLSKQTCISPPAVAAAPTPVDGSRDQPRTGE
jgi:hypothetical protein